MRKRISGLLVGLALVAFTATPALAGGTVNCGGGGYLYTFGKSTINQNHWVDDFGTLSNLGPGTVQIYWGYRSSSYQWDVYGPGVWYESAFCPA